VPTIANRQKRCQSIDFDTHPPACDSRHISEYIGRPHENVNPSAVEFYDFFSRFHGCVGSKVRVWEDYLGFDEDGGGGDGDGTG